MHVLDCLFICKQSNALQEVTTGFASMWLHHMFSLTWICFANQNRKIICIFREEYCRPQNVLQFINMSLNCTSAHVATFFQVWGIKGHTVQQEGKNSAFVYEAAAAGWASVSCYHFPSHSALLPPNLSPLFAKRDSYCTLKMLFFITKPKSKHNSVIY